MSVFVVCRPVPGQFVMRWSVVIEPLGCEDMLSAVSPPFLLLEFLLVVCSRFLFNVV